MRKELHKVLADNIALVNKRVYPLTMPQDTKKPCIVYRFLNFQDVTGITCTTPINTRFSVQIDCLAPSYGESVDMMEDVKQTLRDNFLTFNMMGFEDYLNITLKYRQIIDVQLELKPIYTSGLPSHIVNNGVDVYNNGNLVINY